MPLFNDNDIHALLFFASEDHPSGVHHQLGWQTYAGAESSAVLTSLTSLHESFHNELNNLTAYGFLLQVYAFLVKADGQSAQYQQLLNSLVDGARTTHEVYATFMSTTIIAEQAKQAGISPLTLLADYPAYQAYYRQGQQLASGFHGHYLQEIAVSALVIVSMQMENIIALAKEGLSNLAIEKLRQRDFPDRRLSYFAQHLPEDFLASCFTRFCATQTDQAGVDVFFKLQKLILRNIARPSPRPTMGFSGNYSIILWQPSAIGAKRRV